MQYPLWKDNGRIKLMIIVGTRPEIIRLAAVIQKCRKYFDTILVHTGQNYDYTLNGIFFRDLGLEDPELYLNAVGKDLGETMGNIIASSYQAMVTMKPDAVLVLGDTNSCRPYRSSGREQRCSTRRIRHRQSLLPAHCSGSERRLCRSSRCG